MQEAMEEQPSGRTGLCQDPPGTPHSSVMIEPMDISEGAPQQHFLPYMRARCLERVRKTVTHLQTFPLETDCPVSTLTSPCYMSMLPFFAMNGSVDIGLLPCRSQSPACVTHKVAVPGAFGLKCSYQCICGCHWDSGQPDAVSGRADVSTG